MVTKTHSTTAPQTDPWLTLAQAVEHTQFSERTIRDSINNEHAAHPLVAARPRGRIRIRLSQLDAWMEAQDGAR